MSSFEKHGCWSLKGQRFLPNQGCWGASKALGTGTLSDLRASPSAPSQEAWLTYPSQAIDQGPRELPSRSVPAALSASSQALWKWQVPPSFQPQPRFMDSSHQCSQPRCRLESPGLQKKKKILHCSGYMAHQRNHHIWGRDHCISIFFFFEMCSLGPEPKSRTLLEGPLCIRFHTSHSPSIPSSKPGLLWWSWTYETKASEVEMCDYSGWVSLGAIICQGCRGSVLRVQILSMPAGTEAQGTNSNWLDSQKLDVQTSHFLLRGDFGTFIFTIQRNFFMVKKSCYVFPSYPYFPPTYFSCWQSAVQQFLWYIQS